MAKAKFFVEIDTYYQNSASIFVGPFNSRDAAETAAEKSGATKCGQMTQNVRYDARYEVHNTTSARKAGMKHNNTVSANVTIPGDADALNRTIEDYRLYED